MKTEQDKGCPPVGITDFRGKNRGKVKAQTDDSRIEIPQDLESCAPLHPLLIGDVASLRLRSHQHERTSYKQPDSVQTKQDHQSQKSRGDISAVPEVKKAADGNAAQ